MVRGPQSLPPLLAVLACGLAAASMATAQGNAAAEGSKAARIGATTRVVDGAFIQANATKTPDWPSHGLDYAETRFSRLTQIDSSTLKSLGLAWSYDLESTRGVEATPLVVDRSAPTTGNPCRSIRRPASSTFRPTTSRSA